MNSPTPDSATSGSDRGDLEARLLTTLAAKTTREDAVECLLAELADLPPAADPEAHTANRRLAALCAALAEKLAAERDRTGADLERTRRTRQRLIALHASPADGVRVDRQA